VSQFDSGITGFNRADLRFTSAASSRIVRHRGRGGFPMLKFGQIYRLKFPGIAARVINAPHGQAPEGYSNLMESLFLRSRWYVNDRGEPFYPDAPVVLVPTD
jgi:hypothetical protein